jgi:preprotein translocase subunit SecG
MITFLTIVHVIVCLFLIIVVLLQSGKAADLAGAFGGMGSQTAFGPRGAATVLSKATTIAAVLFMAGSLSLAILYTRAGSGSASTVLENAPAPVTTPAPGTQGIPAGQQTIQMELEDPQTGEKRTVDVPLPPQTPENTKPAPAPKQ